MLPDISSIKKEPDRTCAGLYLMWLSTVPCGIRTVCYKLRTHSEWELSTHNFLSAHYMCEQSTMTQRVLCVLHRELCLAAYIRWSLPRVLVVCYILRNYVTSILNVGSILGFIAQSNVTSCKIISLLTFFFIKNDKHWISYDLQKVSKMQI